MAVCLNCGKETDYCLCEDCRGAIDIEALCQKIIEYRSGSGENPLWDQIASEMAYMSDFRNAVFALADELPTPRKEYWQILSFAGENANVQKYNRPWLYETYGRIKDLDGLSRQELNRIKPVWVELGLQTIHERTAARIRRGYPLPVFEDAVRRLKAAGLTVIVHVILGLPGESREDMLDTVRYLAGLGRDRTDCGDGEAREQVFSEHDGQDEKKAAEHGGRPAQGRIDGIKLQMLHILKGTRMAEEYEADPFPVMSLDEYSDLSADCVRILPEHMVIHRLTGDGPKRFLIAPLWSADKKRVLNTIRRKLQQVQQGRLHH